jgi:succinyl-CoA synthetase beta subunit
MAPAHPVERQKDGMPVDLMEYQAKELFAKHAVPVTLGVVATTPEEARAGAEQLGGRVVVKAQVKAGGRGKAGGVKLAQNPEEAAAHAGEILGMQIKGLTVHRVLLAPTADIAEEYYFSFLVDRGNRNYLCIASVEGGIEIEEVARTNPDAVAKISIDPATGVDEARRARSWLRPASRRRSPSRRSTWCSSCGRHSSPRTPLWSR